MGDVLHHTACARAPKQHHVDQTNKLICHRAAAAIVEASAFRRRAGTLPKKPPDNEGLDRAAVARHSHNSLVAEVEAVRRRLRLERDPAAILDEIKKTMHVVVPPHGLTVIQTLSERERDKIFNEN